MRPVSLLVLLAACAAEEPGLSFQAELLTLNGQRTVALDEELANRCDEVLRAVWRDDGRLRCVLDFPATLACIASGTSRSSTSSRSASSGHSGYPRSSTI
jgi:hypothetical protein